MLGMPAVPPRRSQRGPSTIFSVCIASLRRAENQSSLEYKSARRVNKSSSTSGVVCGDLEITAASPRKINGTF